MQHKEIKQWKLEPEGAAQAYIARVYAEMPANACLVSKLYGFLDEVRRNTCGECVICREGLLQTALLVQGITMGQGRADDLELLAELAQNLEDGSCCDYGKAAGRTLGQDLRSGAEQFEKHLKRKRCDAGVCEKLTSAESITPVGEGLLGGARRRRRSEG